MAASNGPERRHHGDNPSDGSEPTGTEKTANGQDVQVDAPNEPPTSEYPHGMRLVLIMMSLMLSLFVVSLDNVSGILPPHISMYYKCTQMCMGFYPN